MGKLWTQEEKNYLIENYLSANINDLVEYFGRTIDAIQLKAKRIGCKKDIYWDKDKFNIFLNENYGDDYKLIGEFKTVNTKLKIFHKICGKIWNVFPSSLIYSGNKCLNCSKRLKYTHDSFCEKLKKINNHIVVIGEYKSINERVECRCLIDGYEWFGIPKGLLIGNSCPKCINKISNRTQEEYEKELFEINPNIIVIGKYEKTIKKILVKCKIDGFEWKPQAGSLLYGSGCPKCGGVSRYSTYDFVLKMNEINPEIKILGEYIDHYSKIKVMCLNDGNLWEASPHTLFIGVGCPCCSSSKGEKTCVKFLKNNNIDFINQYNFKNLRSDSNLPLRFDFAIMKNSLLFLLIEIDGVGHRKPIKFNGMSEEDSVHKFNLIKYHDSLKDKYCYENNIPLLRISYDGKNNKYITEILRKSLSAFLEGGKKCE